MIMATRLSPSSASIKGECTISWVSGRKVMSPFKHAHLLTEYVTTMSSSYLFCLNASPQVMHCSNLTSLPTLPLPGQETTTEAVVQELLVEESNIHTLWMKKLYNENNLNNLLRLDLVDCGIQTIQEEAFYQMSRLQNLNIRC